MDDWFKEKLAELERRGVADNTIVFFFGDHGSGMPRFKRYAGDTGYHVAMIVNIPPKLRNAKTESFSPNGVSERLVGFVDLGPTVLKLSQHRTTSVDAGAALVWTVSDSRAGISIRLSRANG